MQPKDWVECCPRRFRHVTLCKSRLVVLVQQRAAYSIVNHIVDSLERSIVVRNLAVIRGHPVMSGGKCIVLRPLGGFTAEYRGLGLKGIAGVTKSMDSSVMGNVLVQEVYHRSDSEPQPLLEVR